MAKENSNDYSNVDVRIKTFHGWFSGFVRKMKETGFYRISGTNITKCFYCGLEIQKWKVSDDPLEVHNKLSPSCVVSTNHFFKNMDNRLATFALWEGKQNAKNLAKAGFIYLKNGDLVQCHRCGLKLQNWQENDDAFIVHKKFNKTCDYEYTEISNQELECLICRERKKNVCFIPCGHICCCIECASKADIGRCIVCNTPFTKLLRVFF